MTLQRTDITAGGRSPDVWIPLEARDADPTFWQWPGRYIQIRRQSGTYAECYFRVYINTPSGASLNNVRYYGYVQKSEFRINTDLIRSQASVNDILQIDRIGAGLGYEYEFTVIPRANAAYNQLFALCRKVRAGNSQKRYVYL